MTKKRPRVKTREHRGRRPPEQEIREMAVKGYVLIADVMKVFRVTKHLAYKWSEPGRLPPPPDDARDVVFRSFRGNIWLLRAAIEHAVKGPA